MSYVKCNACVSPWDCSINHECLNCRVTTRAQIHTALAAYDAKREQLAEQRAAMPIWQAAKPVKVVDVKPFCDHTRSTFGICTKCGDWKQ